MEENHWIKKGKKYRTKYFGALKDLFRDEEEKDANEVQESILSHQISSIRDD